jgi:hypothetical protein
MSATATTFTIPTSDIQAKPEHFTTITHTLYGNTKIFRHDATGNYFITGIVKNYNEEKKAEYEALRSKLPSLREKLEKAKASVDDDDVAIAEAQLKDIEILQVPSKVEIFNWLKNKETKRFLTSFKTRKGCSTEQVAFKISEGDKVFHGTYAHRYVMHHLLHWMDPNYAIDVAELLDRYLVEETERYKEQAEEAKQSYKRLHERFDEQSEQMKVIIGYANAMIDQNNEIIGNTKQLLITTDTTQEQLEENLTYTRQTLLMLEAKSLKSTIDPENPNLVTHYCVLVPKNRNATKTRTILVRGQMSRIDKVIEEHSENFEAHVSYSANSINLIINAQAKYDQMVTDYITTHNEPIIERNNALAEAINEFNRLARIHNRKHPKDQRTLRSIKEEKEPLLCKKDIPIMFGRTYITYEQNRFFKYEQVVNCIETMKLETQRSPAESFDEAEKASLEVIASTKTIIDSVSGMIGKLPKRISSKEA